MAEGFVCVGAPAEFPVYETKRVEVDGVRIVVVNTGARFFAFHSVCTHAGGDMSMAWITSADETVCLLHNAVFDMNSGLCTDGPAGDPLPVYEVRVEGEEVLVATTAQPRPRMRRL